MKELATRTNRCAIWQLEQSLPDLKELLLELAEPDEDDIRTVWGRLLLWHSGYTYARLAMGSPTLREAGELYRTAEIQAELRQTVMQMTREVFGQC